MTPQDQKRQRLYRRYAAMPRNTRIELYTEKLYARMANVLGKSMLTARVMSQADSFEAAAMWYRLGVRGPYRGKPAYIYTRLGRVREAADKLCALLNLEAMLEAPTDSDQATVLSFLVTGADGLEDELIRDVEHIERLIDLLDEAMKAAASLEARAKQGAKDAKFFGKRTGIGGHNGDRILNDWVGSILQIYNRLMGERGITATVTGKRKGVWPYPFSYSRGRATEHTHGPR